MDWTLALPARAGGPDGWRHDLPLDDKLPDTVTLDFDGVRPGLHPTFLVRLATFVRWHRNRGRRVLTEDIAPLVLAELGGTGLASHQAMPAAALRVHPPSTTWMTNEREVDDAAEALRRSLIDSHEAEAVLADALFSAVSELASNALQHSGADLGVCLSMRRRTQPRIHVELSIGDLGIGVPEHLRRRYPEWGDDEYAVAMALEDGVSGTGDPHRGYGYNHTFAEALTQSVHAARLEVHSARGFVRRQIVQERFSTDAFSMPQYRRGTLLCWTLTTATG